MTHTEAPATRTALEIATVAACLAGFEAAWGDREVPQYIADAWNALHDADTALRFAALAADARPIPAHEEATAALVALNID